MESDTKRADFFVQEKIGMKMTVKDYCFLLSEQRRKLEKNVLTVFLTGSFSWIAAKEGIKQREKTRTLEIPGLSMKWYS